MNVAKVQELLNGLAADQEREARWSRSVDEPGDSSEALRKRDALRSLAAALPGLVAASASLTQLQAERERLTRERSDAFLGGYCCCLSAALNGDDGTSMSYIEAVAAAGAKELLAYAKREDEMELPRIRRAVAEMRARKQRERKARSSSLPREGANG